MRKGFLNVYFGHTDFSTKILIFLGIYTDFVLDQSGRSALLDKKSHKPGIIDKNVAPY